MRSNADVGRHFEFMDARNKLGLSSDHLGQLHCPSSDSRNP